MGSGSEGQSLEFTGLRNQMSESTEDRSLILEVVVTTGESFIHTYPIPPYSAGNIRGIAAAMDDIKANLEKVRQLLSGEVRALENPAIAYNPSHVVCVKIDTNAEDLQDEIVQEQRRLGFST